MAQKIIGLDLGSHEVKAVLLEGSFRGFAVRRYLTARVPEDPPDAEEPRPLPVRLGEALAVLKTELGADAKVDAVYTAVPATAVTTHLLVLPFTDLRKIEQTLPFELEDQIPFGLEDVVFDSQVLGEHAGKSEVLVGVVKRDFLEGLLAVLAETGFDPKVVSLSALAYQNLYAYDVVRPTVVEPVAGETAPPPVDAVLDVGHGATNLLILEDGAARAARSFPVAGRALTLALAAAEHTGLAEAEALKHEAGTLDPGEGDPRRARIAGALQRGIDALVRGVRQTFFSYTARTRHRVGRLLLTGGTARLAGLADYLAAELGVEVVALDPFPEDRMEIGLGPDRADDPAGALAMSLALRGQGGPRTARINFRTGDLAFRGDLSFVRGNALRFAALGSVLLVLLGANVYSRFHVLGEREAQVDQALCEITDKVLGECLTNSDDAISRLKAHRGPAGVVPRVSATEVLAEIVRRLANMEGVDLNELDIGSTKVRLQGEADTFEAVSRVAEALKAYECFGEVSQGKTRQGRNNEKIEFNLDASMTAECTI